MPESTGDAGTESVAESRQADDDIRGVWFELFCKEAGKSVDNFEGCGVDEEGGDGVVGLGGELADREEEEEIIRGREADGTAVLPWRGFLLDFMGCEEALPVLGCGFGVMCCHVQWEWCIWMIERRSRGGGGIWISTQTFISLLVCIQMIVCTAVAHLILDSGSISVDSCYMASSKLDQM
jgi:hypothetical protein